MMGFHGLWLIAAVSVFGLTSVPATAGGACGDGTLAGGEACQVNSRYDTQLSAQPASFQEQAMSLSIANPARESFRGDPA